MTIYVVLVMSSCHDKNTDRLWCILVYVKLSLQRHYKQYHICIQWMTL